VTQVAQVMLPKASIASGPEAETATVPEAFGKVMVRAAVGSVMAKVVLLASAVAPSKTKGEAPVMLPEERAMLPVVTVKPFDAVSRPAEVIVPEPVVEMLEEVEMVFAVAIVPKPEAIEPETSAPTVVSEDVTTFEASVVPLILAAAFTVIEAFGKVMVLACVGSVMAKVVLLASAVPPSKTKGEAPVMLPEVKVIFPLPVRVWVTVKAPLFVVVIPLRLTESAVAFVVPRLRTPAESTVRLPAAVDQVAAAADVIVSAPVEVDQVEAAPPVKVRAAPEVKDEAPVGVRFTLPAPVTLKFPEVRVKAIGVELAVVIVAPAL